MPTPTNAVIQGPGKGKRTGLPVAIPALNQQDIDRFMSKIDRTPGQGPAGRCHRWTGTFNKAPRPYGVFKAQRQMMYAHRLAFVLEYGADPAPLLVCHFCDQTWCVNPECFFIGNNELNTFDSLRKRRRATGERNARYTHPETTARGERSNRSNLTNEKVLAIVRLAEDNVSKITIAKEMGVTLGTIYHILSGYTWNHVTGKPRQQE